MAFNLRLNKARGEQMAKILVVEDEELLNNLYSELLEMKGHKVYNSYNGQDALSFLEENIPDLILLDINMSVTDGVKFLEHIRAVNKLKRIPIILITGIIQLEKIGKCLDMGALGYIEKANSPIEALNKIDMILGAVIQMPNNDSDLIPERQNMEDLQITAS